MPIYLQKDKFLYNPSEIDSGLKIDHNMKQFINMLIMLEYFKGESTISKEILQ